MAGTRKAKVEVVKTVLVYKDAAKEWRWTAISHNGKKVADSAEGYKNRSFALKMAKELYPNAVVEWGAR